MIDTILFSLEFDFKGDNLSPRWFLLTHENTFLRLSMFHAARLSVSPLFFFWPIPEREASIYCFPTHDYTAMSCFKQILAVYLDIRDIEEDTRQKCVCWS